jgi:D-lactate dehydrogenase (cytochrome)
LTRPARGDDTGTAPEKEAAHIEPFLLDAAHFPGGHADAVAFPRTEREVSRLVANATTVLPIGAQSSLTGGATPSGGLVLSTARLASIERVGPSSVRVGAGVPLVTLQEQLDKLQLYYPPVPTFTGAFVGGVVATNAAGAATFKYGSTRHWVEALSVVLASGEVLDVRRGEHTATDGWLEIGGVEGRIRIPVPRYRMPQVAKVSAGYFAAPGMDLIDLFIGSEGTLGVITSATLRVVPADRTICWALVFSKSESAGMRLVEWLRTVSLRTRAAHDPFGVDAASIEYMDRRSLKLLQEDDAGVRCNVTIPDAARVAILAQLELSADISAPEAYAQIGGALGPGGTQGPLAEFSRMLDELGLLDHGEVTLPGDRKRIDELLALREAVPGAVNLRIASARRDDPRVEKIAGDPIVPFERLHGFLRICREAFDGRGLDSAIWGHVSDGNLHPNVIPRSADDVRRGKEAILEIGRAALACGGCPLAEHGVGRNPVKQALLRDMYGDAGIDEMRRVKRALDPTSKLAPGVLFDPDV